VGAALILLDHGNPIGVPAVGAETAGVVERQACVVSQFRTGDAFDGVLVVEGRSLAAEVHLGEGWCAGGQHEERDGRDGALHRGSF
jgi:hypothetical protein